MGTKTMGNLSGPSDNSAFFFVGTSGGVAFRASSNSVSTPEEMYVDSISVWCGTQDGTAATIVFALYGTGGTKLGQADLTHSFGTGYAYNHGEFSAGNFLHLGAGANVVGAAYSFGHGLQTAGFKDGGSFNYHQGTNFPSPWSSTGTKSDLGAMAWKATYFPVCQITSVPQTPVAPGQTLAITGKSFSAGITSITIHGAVGDTTVSTFTVDSDTQVTVTIPTGTTTGPIEIDTNAGNATSSQSILTAGGWFKTGGVINPLKGMWFKTGGVINPIKGAWYKTGGVINPLK